MSMTHKEALEAAVVAFEAWGGGSDGMDRAVRRYCKERWLALVPKELTEIMEDAGLDANPRGRTISGVDLRVMFTAMLAAAPDFFKDDAA